MALRDWVCLVPAILPDTSKSKNIYDVSQAASAFFIPITPKPIAKMTMYKNNRLMFSYLFLIVLIIPSECYGLFIMATLK
jgi:hypothetical protein